jgi:argininosuccinate lyase
MEGVIRTLTVDKKRMLAASSTSYAVSLDIAEQLVKKGLPFRNAHKIVGALVGIAVEKKIPLVKLESSDFDKVLKKVKPEGTLDAADLQDIVKEMTPARSIALRKSAGSPGPKEQDAMIAIAKAKSMRYRVQTQKRTKSVQKALDGLAKTVNAYLKG